MNILSLFDGISCARVALEQAGIEVTHYFASEIDKYAIKIATKNYPDTIHIGDIQSISIQSDGIHTPTYIHPFIPDIICAGSPCQGFSKAGKGLNFEDPRSKLFFEFIRILNECRKVNPNLLFLLENVDMLQEWQDIISRAVGVMPIKINSVLVSPQNRVRLYWTNIGVTNDMFGHIIPAIPQPKDRKLVLSDILEEDVDEKYFLSKTATDRIHTRNKHYRPQINPEKTGTINSGNQSGKCTDNGTTYVLLSDRGIHHSIKEHTNGKTSPLSSRDGCAFDHKIVVHSGYGRTGGKKQGGTGPLSRDDGKTYSLDTSSSTNRVELIGGTINNQEFKANKANKANNIDANYFKGHDNHGARTVIQINESIESGGKQPYQQNRIYSVDGISPAIQAQLPQSHAIEINYRIRRLTPIECERLQGMPDTYTEGISDSQRYKCLGNGWQIDTIVHILSFLTPPSQPLALP